MTRRLAISLLTLIVCSPVLAFCQRSSAPQSGVDLYVYVTYANESPAASSCRVELLTATRMRITEEVTNREGLAIFRGVGAGDFRLVAKGIDIEEAEISITVESRPGYNSSQNEHIQVRRIVKGNALGTSTEGAVSAATLNIPDKAKKEYEKGLAALDHRDIAGAHEHLAKSVELYPQYCAALLNLGVIAMQSGHQDDGMHYFEQATQADPKNPAGFMYLARAYLAKKNYKEAEPLLVKAVAIIPSNPEPLTLLATLQLQQGEFAQAVSNAQRVHALQQHQQYAIAHYVAAEALMKQFQPQQAAEEYRLFLKEAPASPMAAAARDALNSIEQAK